MLNSLYHHSKLLYESKVLIKDTMSPKKRFKDQIIAEILKACVGEGTNKTRVVYASGLNFLTIEPYLATLDRNNLIEIIPGSRPLYRTTQKGNAALLHLKAIEELISVP